MRAGVEGTEVTRKLPARINCHIQIFEHLMYKRMILKKHGLYKEGLWFQEHLLQTLYPDGSGWISLGDQEMLFFWTSIRVSSWLLLLAVTWIITHLVKITSARKKVKNRSQGWCIRSLCLFHGTAEKLIPGGFSRVVFWFSECNLESQSIISDSSAFWGPPPVISCFNIFRWATVLTRNGDGIHRQQSPALSCQLISKHCFQKLS